jgi:hypothetical protein
MSFFGKGALPFPKKLLPSHHSSHHHLKHQTAAQMRKLVNEERLNVLLISQTPFNLRCTKGIVLF